MKKKVFLTAALLCAFSLASFAQLTTGEPSAKKIRTGNRAQAGDFGLYIGFPINNYVDDIKYGDLVPFPIVNLKFFALDQLEVRASIDAKAYSQKAMGKLMTTDKKLGEGQSSGHFLVLPGVAWHFAKSNIVDVYAGAELPIGWSGAKQKMVDETADSEAIVAKNACSLGIGAFIGLQFFIANLPVALGVEYGLSSQFDLGLKYKNTMTSAGTTQVFYTSDINGSLVTPANQFEKLEAKRGNLGQQVRLTLSYYFK